MRHPGVVVVCGHGGARSRRSSARSSPTKSFGRAVRDLAEAVHASGYEPDWLVAIARGGLVIGGALGVRARPQEHRDGERRVLHGHRRTPRRSGRAAAGAQPRRHRQPPRARSSTMSPTPVRRCAWCMDKCAPAVVEVRAAVLYEKPRSIVRSDYVVAAHRSLDRLPVVGRTADRRARNRGPDGYACRC